ncbi:MAG: cytochrome-c oxidase, cbb3-type subunit III [Gammaproteobacteria bacterium]|nr:cytochrome-c oxidase, cbb3-type subunit III [Gammaproteobacteria bacterium]NNM01827.1 cytochrome-c oxidase, cbb3-type subunit III [Gammaproteobacteria bacterium]
MADFTSPFWSWFIIVLVVVSFIALFWLILWMSGGRPSGDKVETMGHVWDDNLEELNNPLPKWWLNLFYITIFFGIAYLVLFPGMGTFKGVLGWTSLGQYEAELAYAAEQYDPLYEQYVNQPIPEIATDEEALDIGRRLYATYCTTCHGADARGVRGFPNLRDHDWLWGGAPEQIQLSIVQGRSGLMPAWKDLLETEQIFNVSQYVRSMSGKPIDPVVAEAGKQVYMTNCAVCHGAEGGGNQLMGSPNLADNIWLYGGTQKQIIESINNGRNGKMPAHGEFLGEAKVHLLANYIYSLSMVTPED